MKLPVQISAIIVALMFVYSINFKSFITIDYFFNQAEITELFCVNKEKIQLKCNGKCHLTKELVKSESEKSETPFSKNINETNVELFCDIIATEGLTNTSFIKNNKWFSHSESIIAMDYSILTPPPKNMV